MSAAPARFTFDLDLGRREEKNRLVTEGTIASIVSEARAAGFAEGFAAGENGATAKAARRLAEAAEAIGDRVAGHTAAIDDLRRATAAEASALAAAIAGKLAAALIARFPTAEIEALVAECLATLDGVPHLVIRCNDSLADAVREIATRRMETSGFTGRLVVLGEPDIALGDCRLEWVDGGLVRDHAALMREVENRVAAFVAAMQTQGAHGAGETD